LSLIVTEPLRILVADDEPLASERLSLLLARVADVTLVGTAHDGTEAITLAEQLAPDVVMLDIAMPGLDGIEVARALSRLPRSPAVVFVTAYDQFAVAAFEVAAVDYLMKPADSTRLDRALERARAFLVQRGPATARAEGDAPRYLDEFWASDMSGLVRIAARDIDRVSADADPRGSDA
jgi:two-component system response regulator AlgR